MKEKEIKFRLALAGGGTGGHIYPLIAVAEEIQKSALENKFLLEARYFGMAGNFKEEMEKVGIISAYVSGAKIRRYFSLLNILDIPKFFIGLIQAFFKMFWFMPDVLFSKGGTGSFPAVLAAWFYRVPIVIHESDAYPGLNSLLAAPFSKRIGLAFPAAQKYFNPYKSFLAGVPVRQELLKDRLSKDAARSELGFVSGQPLLLILGGSQGSRRINEFILTLLKDLIKDFQILHQTGKENYKEMEKMARAALMEVPLEVEIRNKYQMVSYFDVDPYSQNNLGKALAAADLIISRAGSGSIFEMAAFGKPALLIPLGESANDHQRLNAYEFAKAGAAVVIEEENLLPGVFTTQLKELFRHPEFLEKMSTASSNFFKPDAAKTIADEILKVAA